MEKTIPRVVLIAAALSIVFGASALVEMGESLFRGSLKIDLGFVGIPIGSGLLAGRRSSRSWAIGLSGLGLLLTVAIFSWGFFRGPYRDMAEDQLWLLGAARGLNVIVLATVLFGLYSTEARSWFKAETITREGSSAWVTPLVLVGIFYAVSSELQTHITESKIRNCYALRTRFTFRDSVTGAPVKSVGWSSEAYGINSGKRDLLAPRVSYSSRTGPEGLELELRGLTGRSFDISFTSEGYQPHVYTLDKQTPREVTISLEPSK